MEKDSRNVELSGNSTTEEEQGKLTKQKGE